MIKAESKDYSRFFILRGVMVDVDVAAVCNLRPMSESAFECRDLPF